MIYQDSILELLVNNYKKKVGCVFNIALALG